MSDGTVNDLSSDDPVLSWCDEVLPGVGVIATHFWAVVKGA